MIQVTSQAAVEHPPETKEIKDCLLECMSCRELWGAIYDGHACANGCFLTNGGSIDQDCRLGASMPKRYAEIKSIDECRKKCKLCATKYSPQNYDANKCLETCDLTTGKHRDSTCSHYLTLFKLK